MAITYSDYTGDGSNKDFAFSFPYLEDTHVVVEVDGVDKTTTAGDFTLPTTSLVRMTVAPADAATVRVKRVSDSATDLVDFTNGSVLTESDLDRAYQHNRYLNEESIEGATSGLTLETAGADYTALSKKIKNLGDGTLATDAVNKGYVDTQVALTSTNLAGFYKSTHTGDNTETEFTLSFTPQTADAKAYIVTIDGVVQIPDTAYTIGTTSITFTSAPPTSGAICVVATAAASVATVDEAQITATGATTARTLGARAADSVSVKDFGAVGDGGTNDAASIQAALNAFDNVLIPKGTYILNTDLTLDSGKTLSFLDGGVISVSATKTLTINGCITAGLYKVFEGSGTIRINPGETQEVVASWWGASPGATASVNTTAIQSSIDALGTTFATTPVQTHSFTWRLPGGSYNIDTEIEFKTEIHYAKIFFDGLLNQTTSNANGIKFNNVYYSDINITKITASHYFGLGTRTSGSGVLLDGAFGHSNLDMADGSGLIYGFEKGIHWSNKDDACSLGYSSFTLGHIQHCHYGVYAVLQSNDYPSWMNTNIFRKGQISPSNATNTNGSATPSISAITQASLGVITTSTAHGLSVDDDIIVTGVVGMTEINCDTDIYLVNSVPTSTTFTLKQLDGGGPGSTAVNTSAFTAYTGGGVVARATYGLVFKNPTTGAGGYGRTNRFEFQTLEGLAKGYDLRSMAGCVVDCPYMEANVFDADLRAVKDMTWISGMNAWADGKRITDSNTESLNVLSPSNDTVHEGDLILGTKGINFDTYGGAGNTTDRGHLNYTPTYWSFIAQGGGVNSFMNKGIEGGTSAPTSGSYRQGAIVWNTSSISTGQTMGFMCKTFGTAGTLSGVTATTVNGSPTVTVNSVDNLKLYDNINIATVGGSYLIVDINKQTKEITLSANANGSATSQAVSYLAPTWQQLPNYP
jgi:hypothetical protein